MNNRSLPQFVVPSFLVGVLGFAALFFGGVHVWSRSVVILAIYAFFALIFWIACKRAAFVGPPQSPSLSALEAETRYCLEPVTLLGLFLLAWAMAQLIPLPAGLVARLSPETARLCSAAAPATPRLSLYPFMTLDTVLLGLAFFCYYWVALYALRDRGQIYWVVLGILALGLFESLYGLVQLAAGRNTILWWENPFSGNVVTGTFINRNHLAGFLSMAICLGIGYLWSLGRQEGRGAPEHGESARSESGRREPSRSESGLESERERRSRRHHRPRLRDRVRRLSGEFGIRGILVALALALMLAALLGSASRGGALSLVCGVVFMLGLILSRWFRSRRWFVLMVLLSLVLSYVGYVAADRLVGRLATLDAGLEDRIELAREAWTMAKDFPLTGSGAGTFEFVFPRYQQVHLAKLVEHAHNDWVQLLAEYGWPGLLAAAAALSAFLILSIGLWRERHNAFAVGIGVGGIGAVVSIAVHSLSDFNLRIPANVLLLALILAVTWRALHTKKEGKDRDGLPAALTASAAPPASAESAAPAATAPAGGPAQGWTPGRAAAYAVLAVLLGLASLAVIRTWRADALARSFADSTRLYRVPAPEQLRQARSLTPGNAGYWLMTAERLRLKPGERETLLSPGEVALPEPAPAMLAEGLRRHPSSWQIWRELGWTRFLGSSAPGKNREAELRAAFAAMGTAASLRPADPRLQMESGTVALAAFAAGVQDGVDRAWRQAFGQALKQEPKLAANVADLLLLYLGAKGAPMVREVLPPEAAGRLTAANFLIAQGYWDSGMALFRDGVERRAAEADAIWKEFKGGGGSGGRQTEGRNGRDAALLNRAVAADPAHPGILLMRGQVLPAMRAIERRGEPMAKWWHVRAMAARLDADLTAKRGDPAEQCYYLGLLAQEEGNREQAFKWFNRALNLRGQYFPAWIRLRGLMKESVRSEADRIQFEALEGKIRLFAMDGIVPEVWKPAGLRLGRPAWRAPFRLAEPVRKVSIRFSAAGGGVWALDVDGRFVDIWKIIGGQTPYFSQSETGEQRTRGRGLLPYFATVETAIPAGEHEFTLTSWSPGQPAGGKDLPFRLDLSWK